ncbi:MAG: hypothetical protein HZA89_03985 [Verrucomicrobia bacterium]|nr:hypothetical protein [Verrucomicrobiota bacterium]
MESSGPILVCFAVAEEARPFQKIIAGRGDLHVLVTGMGARRAGAAIQKALAEVRPRGVITSGFAGGLNPDLPRGTVLFDADDNFPLPINLPNSAARPAKFHCAERVASTAAEKLALRRQTGADAVEMESAVIRAACRAAGIPGATVRVISDAADEDLPLDFNRFLTADGGMNYATLAWAVVKSPAKIGELRSFQKRLAYAAEILAQVLTGLLR